MKLILAAVISVLLAIPAGAADFGRAAVGTSGSEFMLFDTSARGIAMGGAYSAAVNDASAVYWNPAGLSQVPRLSATVLHAQYIADITYNAAAVAARVNDASVLAIGVRYLDAGSIARTDINGVGRGSFTPRSYLAEVGWGQSIYDLSDSEVDVALGVAAKYLYTDMVEKASGYGTDFGVQSRFYGSARTYDVSLALQNLGVGQRFDQVRDTLPARLRFGGGVRPTKPLLLTVEAIAPINNSPYGAAGMEYSIDVDKSIKGAVRAGINSSTYESLGITSMLAFGFGLSVSDLTFDYAFAPMGDLGGQVHRISVSFNLPAKVSRRYRER
jgi:hypothetical protein